MQASSLAALSLLLVAGKLGAAEPGKLESSQSVPAEPLITLNLNGLGLRTVVESLTAQSGERVLVATNIRAALGPDINLSQVPLSRAIETVAAAYDVCVTVRAGPIFYNCDRFRTDPSAKVLLGVALQSAGTEDNDLYGAIVSRVTPNSAAQRAGLQRGDTIVSFNGRRINNALEMPEAIREIEPGAVVTLEILRENQRQSLTVQF